MHSIFYFVFLLEKQEIVILWAVWKQVLTTKNI